MGVCLDKPITEKSNEQGSGNGLNYGVASMQGWRMEMEDTHVARCGLADLPDWSFFAVFDGHAGAAASAHCAARLLDTVLDTEEFRRREIAEGIRAGFLRFDEDMRDMPEVSLGTSGSTAICAWVSPTKVHLANCGDSRAVLCRGGAPAMATRDHKPALPEERDRIIRAGGSVMISRVNGSLAVSRALGDYAYKSSRDLGPTQQLVSPEPEVLVWERDLERDQFLVLACDGIWDVMCNEDICSYVSALLKITDDLTEVTNRLIDTCLAKGSYDNMTVVLVTFPAAPTPEPEGRTDAQLEEAIYRRITELVSQGEKRRSDITKELRNLPGLLPGGGIHDKWNVMRKHMNDLGLLDNEEEHVEEK